MSEGLKETAYEKRTRPLYRTRRNSIVVVCSTLEDMALVDDVMALDREGGKDTAWWGHPELSTDSHGVTTLTLPVNAHNMSLLHRCGARPDKDDTETRMRVGFFVGPKRSFDTKLPLRDFQRESCAWLSSRDMKGILSLEMGLGKTLVSLAVLLDNPERYLPAVVIAPAHVKLNWEGEWLKWGGDKKDIAVLFGRTPDAGAVRDKKVVVLNHHILAAWFDTLTTLQPKTLIVDEAHSFVNSGTKTYPYAERLARVCGRRTLLITATPLVNNLSDLWGLCNLINTDILGLKKVFAATFMPEEEAKRKMFISRWRGVANPRAGWARVSAAKLPKDVMERRVGELGGVLNKTVMLSKKKRDVIADLPSVTETHLKLEIPGDDPFWDVENNCLADIAEAKADPMVSSDLLFPAFSTIRQNAAMAKVPYAADWIDTFLEESAREEKLVVVGWSVAPLAALAERFRGKCLVINGSLSAQKKREAQKRFFDEPKRRVLFGNIKSIGSGIDLDVARTMLFVELPLTGVDFKQAKGRIDRPSKVANPLSYYYMTIMGSYEDNVVWKIINRKIGVAEKLGV